MHREFSVNTATRGSIIFGSVLAVIGLVVMVYSLLFGALVVGAAVLIFFLMRNFANDTTISCHDQGFSVKVENKRRGTTLSDYKWEDVVSTQYYEKELSDSDGNSTTTSYFTVKTGEGVAFDLQEMRGFADLIDIFNQNTLHIPYYWEKSRGILSSGYSKKQRSIN
ncbi:hypothetical protein D1B31_14520 [Neobacillus notoginsengisoli]|uniref:Uncharacterized protein n=1 Tax=Neobacillus notoginsengisoli TaxID=1578198 RepID=A0A417YRG1_9BACI|nr:hypothetical protein [Neobacillus notoginsengisoli]RHW37993.1 hypothetical protein D1B31_14520 [Neobacillus notoginsengisoli]